MPQDYSFIPPKTAKNPTFRQREGYKSYIIVIEAQAISRNGTDESKRFLSSLTGLI
jgi:hypothetical protein